MVDHPFGGPWTEIKLDAVQYYLECYAKALTPKKFELWYIDAFAGTGDRVETRKVGGLLEGIPESAVTETLAGSARRALKVEPPFHHFIFNEMHAARRAALQKILTENPDRDIEILDTDANAALRQIFGRSSWAFKDQGKARGVVFLDPYALQVDWSTLTLLAETRAIDVWYLFPLRDVTRQLAIRKSGIGPKEPKMDKVLGPEWRDLYSLPSPSVDLFPSDLFGAPTDAAEEERKATQKQIEQWFRCRLQGIFGYASEPLPLLTGNSRHAFSLFLAVANRGAPAINLAKHFHKYVMGKFGPASHQMSGL
jgi:three-Cys-motif partner protein